MEYIWGHSRRFNAYSNYFRRTYGERRQKVSVDAGFTCPNRDGTVGTEGCKYCNNASFNPSYCNPADPISEQLRKGIAFHQKRYRKVHKYLAYFQPFSNTYASLEKLKVLYDEALSFPNVVGVVVSTRTDCMDDEKLAYFAELSAKHHVIIEYGIESCYEKTLAWMNRGHTFAQSKEMIFRTHACGLRQGVHLIIGLPGESREEILQEAGILSALPVDSVKLHQLQIIKGTPIESEFQQHPERFSMFTLEEYLDLVIDFLELLRPTIVVERFAGEVPPDYIESYNWGHIRNEQIIQMMEKRLEERDTFQGKRF
ncbi:MAG: TIGR01212 family radical SAM protein [Bacteroidetes bacterium]|nr:TIGR01212 family radical SAM protein [Bacteroidota bacterium]